MVAFSKCPKKRDIQCFRAVLGEDCSFKTVAVKNLVKFVSAVLYKFCAGDRKLVSASSRMCAHLNGGGNGGKYAVGFSAARSGIVKINHNTPLALFFSYIILQRKTKLDDSFTV